jgi:PKD repeat protein
MKTIDHFRMRRALALLMAGLALGGIVGNAFGQFQMYRMQNLGAGGGVPAQAFQNTPVVNGGNCTLSWYGTMGWYTIQGSTNVTGPWNNLGTVEATGYAWQTVLPDPDTTNNYGFFQLSQANSYASSQPCSACHSAQYVPWTATAHAGAYNALVSSHMNNNSSCLLCHTVGFNQPTGFTNATLTASLEGVGCENCHGPAGWHKNSDHTVILPAVSVDPEICGSCHQGYNPQYNEYTNSLHYMVVPDVAYGYSGGVYYTNTVVLGTNTLYGYYVTTNSDLSLTTNAASGIINSSYVPGAYYDPGQSRQSTCGMCHSGATRVAMINNYAAQLAGTVTPLTFPTAADSGAWGPSCATCHNPHSLTPSPVFGDISNNMVVVATNWVQLRNPLWSSNFYTLPSVSDQRVDPLGNPYYMNTTFMSMYNPSINVCGQCHNTRGARWDGKAYGVISSNTSITNQTVVYCTYITNYNMYGQITGILTNDYPQYVAGSVPVTNTMVTTITNNTVGLTAKITGFSRAPHLSPQYNMLIGILQPDYLNTTNGKTVYTGGILTNGMGIYATHSGIAATGTYNTNQCATCHVPSYTGAAGNVSGHTFNIDPNGCALGGCHGTFSSYGKPGAPDYIDYALENSNAVVSVADLLNTWATNNAPALFGGRYATYLQNSWEYTAPGALASLTNAGPSSSDQLLLPTNIQQARFDIYMVDGDGTFGTHNPTFIPLLIKDAETKVLNQLPVQFTTKTASHYAFVNYGGPGVSITFSNLTPGVSTAAWNFGDGGSSTSTAAAVTHSYTNAGVYSVSLTVNGANTLTRNNFINIYSLPTASYASSAAPTNHPATMTFTNTSLNANYGNWAFYTNAISNANGVGGMSSPLNVSQFFTFTSAGTYIVVFTASSPGGGSAVTNTIVVP